jgi:antitoxin PrlF
MKEITESAITNKGRVTIPRAVRDYLRLKPGDRVKFLLDADGGVELLPKLPVTALRGMFKSERKKTVTINDMSRAAADGGANLPQRRWTRTRRG